MGGGTGSESGRLAGRRILVVGASSGIGATTVRELLARGACVAAVARRAERLAELADGAAESGAGGDRILSLPGDVRRPGEPESWIAATVDRFGGLDAVVYAAGLARHGPLAEADFADWCAALETNLVGAAMVTRAVLEPLARSRGRVLYVSSVSALDHPPRSGLGLYMTTKCALDKMITVWAHENPDVDFTRVSVGDTAGTELGLGWDPAVALRAYEEWIERGYSIGRMQDPEVVARHLADLVDAEESVPFTCVQPRRRAS